jgi:hypothetical protein
MLPFPLCRSRNQKTEMVSGVDQDEIVPLLFRQRAKERVREGSGRHGLKCADLGTELVDGGGLVMAGPGEPPLGHLDTRLHSPLTQNSLENQRADKSADDPSGLMVNAVKSRSEAFADVVQNLRQIPIPRAVIVRLAKAVDIRQQIRPGLEVEMSSVER